VVTASQAISDLDWLDAGRRHDDLDAGELPPADSAYQKKMRSGRYGPLRNVSVPRCREDTVRRLAGIPAGGNYRDLPDGLRVRYLTGTRWGPHNGSGKLARSHYYAYRRLHPDIWAWTLNTKGDSVYHYRAARSLSVREFARLQSFPDRFVFTTDPRRGTLPGRIDGGAAHSRYRQAGNAVPPLLAYAVAVAVRDAVSRAGTVGNH
jgi:DNA (cytosine-5)-methyltransferase 1